MMVLPSCTVPVVLRNLPRADVEVALAIERKVGARQDALFSLAHVPNRDVWRDAARDNPMEEFASPVRCVSGEPFGLEPQSLVRPLDHRLCRSDLVISTATIARR